MSGSYTLREQYVVGLEAPLKSDFAMMRHPYPMSTTSGVVVSPAAALHQQQQQHQLQMTMLNSSTEKDLAKKLYGIVDPLDNGNHADSSERREANRKLLVCGKNLVNNKQKQCDEDDDDYDVDGREEQQQQQQADESTPKAESLKYGSMCLNNPFAEKKTNRPPEHGRNGGEGQSHAVRLLCDNNRNRKGSFPDMISGSSSSTSSNGENGHWHTTSQDVVDINENFMEPVIHRKLRMAYVEHSATTTNHQHNNNSSSSNGTHNNINNNNSKGCYAAGRFGGGPGSTPVGDMDKPKRPQSISVGNNVFNHQLNHRDQFKGFINDGRSNAITSGRILDANMASLGFSVFKAGLDSDESEAGLDQQQRNALRGAPIVPHRRSQSTPRPAHNGHNVLSNVTTTSTAAAATHSSEARKKSENRPKSLDRGVTTYLENVTVQSSVNFNVMHSTMYNQFAATSKASPSAKELLSKNTTIGGMKSSATFHGQCFLSTEAELGRGLRGGGGRINHEGIRQTTNNNRPLSYTCGSISEQAFLENQLRVYSEQLKTITESVRQYSEKAKLLSELKRQEMLKSNKKSNGYSMPTSKSDSKLSLIALQGSSSSGPSDPLTNPQLNQSHKQTSSHQLRLFLEDIRSNIRDSSVNISSDVNTDKASAMEAAASDNAGPAGPLLYSEPIRKMPPQPPPPIPERKRQTPTMNDRSASAALSVAAVEPECKPDLKQPGNPLLNNISSSSSGSGTTTATTKMLRSNEMDFNQILDNFNCATKRFMGTNRADYREDYLTAMRRTSNEIRQAAQNIKRNASGQQDPNGGSGGGGGSSDENSSTSTTPGSIREAVQSLLAMPRNGVQVMDDRMRLFIDILDTQDKLSQVDGVFI